MNFLDYLFPKRCVICKKHREYICENCFVNLSFDAKNLCLVCGKPSFNNLTHPVCYKRYSINGCFSALSYNKTTKKLIYSFKQKPFLTDMSSILSDLFYESLIQNEYFNIELKRANWVFIPIPLFPSRFRKRGFNQAEILAKELSQKFKLPIKNILSRVKDAKTGFGKPNADRKLNIKDAFIITNNKLAVVNRNVFLVDDVVISGSVLKEAASVLKRSGVKRVIGLTLARK